MENKGKKKTPRTAETFQLVCPLWSIASYCPEHETEKFWEDILLLNIKKKNTTIKWWCFPWAWDRGQHIHYIFVIPAQEHSKLGIRFWNKLQSESMADLNYQTERSQFYIGAKEHHWDFMAIRDVYTWCRIGLTE